MHKKILRILSLALAILLLVSVIPQEISANELEVSEIRKQITSTYKMAKKYSGRKSFSGYCASLVNWQLYLMGITTEKTSQNGNQEYDYFSKRPYSSGGYRINAYPATRYSMEDALNFVSRDGTKDAYNIIVCFQSASGAAGRRYGHAFLVHAIIDGVVYFSESSAVSINGKYYAEGSAIAVPIKEFCEYYTRFATFEGLICFGRKTYADECEYFSSNLYASVTEATPLYTSPCTTETDSRSNLRYHVAAGERVHVVGLYRNDEGEYWYELDDGHNGYIQADKTTLISLDYSDVRTTDIVAPHNLRAGTRFGLKGHIATDHNSIYTVRAEISHVDGDTLTQVHSATVLVDGLDYELKGSTLSNNLPFRKLAKGTYQYKLSAVIGNYYFADGAVQLEWNTICLWNSQFEVVSSRGKTSSVVFDSNGGTNTLDQLEVKTGSAIGALPTPERPGYVFAGWYTAKEGGHRVNADEILAGNTTLYARWVAVPSFSGWVVDDGTWYCIREGRPYQGFVKENGITYYTDKNGVPSTGWITVDGQTYYFSDNGVMQTGLTHVDDKLYLFDENGNAVTGWIEYEGSSCYLNEDGSFATGWTTIDGDQHYFDLENGALILTSPAGTGPFEFIIHDNVKAADLMKPLMGFLDAKPPMMK